MGLFIHVIVTIYTSQFKQFYLKQLNLTPISCTCVPYKHFIFSIAIPKLMIKRLY